MQRYTVYYIWKLLYMFRVVSPPIIRSSYNCVYSIWYLSDICVTNTRWCRYSCFRSWWLVVVPPEACRAVSRYNKQCNVASCWIYIRIFLRCTDPWTLNWTLKSLTLFRPSYSYTGIHWYSKHFIPFHGYQIFFDIRPTKYLRLIFLFFLVSSVQPYCSSYRLTTLTFISLQ